MKVRYPVIMALLFFSLSSFLILTPPEYVQCQHTHPDECFDLFGVPKKSISSFSSLTFILLTVLIFCPLLNVLPSQYISLKRLPQFPNMSGWVLSTTLLRE